MNIEISYGILLLLCERGASGKKATNIKAPFDFICTTVHKSQKGIAKKQVKILGMARGLLSLMMILDDVENAFWNWFIIHEMKIFVVISINFILFYTRYSDDGNSYQNPG